MVEKNVEDMCKLGQNETQEKMNFICKFRIKFLYFNFVFIGFM